MTLCLSKLPTCQFIVNIFCKLLFEVNIIFFAAFDTTITTAPTAGENPSVVVSTTSSDFEVVSSKQTVSSSIIIGVSRSTTKEQSLKPKEPARVAPKIKLGINTSG